MHRGSQCAVENAGWKFVHNVYFSSAPCLPLYKVVVTIEYKIIVQGLIYRAANPPLYTKWAVELCHLATIGTVPPATTEYFVFIECRRSRDLQKHIKLIISSTWISLTLTPKANALVGVAYLFTRWTTTLLLLLLFVVDSRRRGETTIQCNECVFVEHF